MIHEFAVDPDLVISWCRDRYAYRYYIDKFGLGTPRIVSEYPVKKKIRKIFKKAQTDLEDIEVERLMELFNALTETLVTRKTDQYDGVRSWRDNAVEENSKVPFHAIFTSLNPQGHDCILKESDVLAGSECWDLPYGYAVNRTVSDMVDSVSCLLKNSKKICFIDPYFFENKLNRWLLSLESFCEKIPSDVYKSDDFYMEYICSADLYDGTVFNVFKKNCDEKLPSILPDGFKLKIKRYTEGSAGQKLHNRYILTDIGGVLFQHGFDGCEVDDGQTDDVNLLDRRQYIQRWEEYISNPVFEIEGEFTVVGVKRE